MSWGLVDNDGVGGCCGVLDTRQQSGTAGGNQTTSAAQRSEYLRNKAIRRDQRRRERGRCGPALRREPPVGVQDQTTMGRRRRFRAPAPFPRRAHDSQQDRRRPGLADRRAAQTTGKGRPGRRSRIHRRQAGARGRQAAGELHDPPHPRERRPGAPRTRETPQGIVHEVRGVPARRTVAVGLHPLADRHGSGSRGRLPARRPLPQPAARACVRHGDDGRRAGRVPSGVRRTRHPRQDAHRQRHRVHHQTDQRHPGAFRTHARADGRAPEQRTALPTPRRRARSNATTAP